MTTGSPDAFIDRAKAGQRDDGGPSQLEQLFRKAMSAFAHYDEWRVWQRQIIEETEAVVCEWLEAGAPGWQLKSAVGSYDIRVGPVHVQMFKLLAAAIREQTHRKRQP